jgi:hypothetical protein
VDDQIKRRRVERIGQDRLPDHLKKLVLVFDTGEEIAVETFDASTLGLGLSVPRSADAVREHVGVLIRASDHAFRLLGEIVFIIPVGGQACRIGVQFTQTIAVEGYLALLPS